MTENGKPRHLDDSTAFMPAVPRVPRHARPETSELRAQRRLPPVPQPDGVAPPPTEVPRVTRRETREQLQRVAWWKRWLGLTK